MNFYTCQQIEDETFIVERVKVSQQVSNKSFDDLKTSYENMICMEIGVSENDVIYELIDLIRDQKICEWCSNQSCQDDFVQ